MPLKTHVEFRTKLFPPYEDEEWLINPGRYGKRLAEFLIFQLKEKRFNPGNPIAEDWGWVIPIENKEFRLWIGCGNYDEHPDGFLCFIEPHQATIRKFFRSIDSSARINALREAIDQILSSNPAITHKRWWSYAEFNRLA